jgi:hypothetical protein
LGSVECSLQWFALNVLCVPMCVCRCDGILRHPLFGWLSLSVPTAGCIRFWLVHRTLLIMSCRRTVTAGCHRLVFRSGCHRRLSSGGVCVPLCERLCIRPTVDATSVSSAATDACSRCPPPAVLRWCLCTPVWTVTPAAIRLVSVPTECSAGPATARYRVACLRAVQPGLLSWDLRPTPRTVCAFPFTC